MKARREEQSKLYAGDLNKIDNAGKFSPGPQYLYQDMIKYDEVSRRYN